MRTVRVTVPATSANLGPGFDSLALALGLYNVVELSELESGFDIEVAGDHPGRLPLDSSNMVARGAIAVFRRTGFAPGGLRIHLESNIPPGSGLGSSAAALLGGVIAANVLLGDPLARSEVLDLAIALEGHPNSICAALYGGLVVSSYYQGELLYSPVPVAPLTVVVALPDAELINDRRILPQTASLDDAIFNIGRSLLVMQALMQADYHLLSRALEDRLHQPTRSRLIRGYDAMREAARRQGAAGVAISGSGPALVAFAAEGHADIASAMLSAAHAATGSVASCWILPIDTQGISISEAGPAITARPIPASQTPIPWPYHPTARSDASASLPSLSGRPLESEDATPPLNGSMVVRPGSPDQPAASDQLRETL